MLRAIENKIIENFKERDSFDKDELYKFYLAYEPELKESTFNWRIYNLNKKGIIKKIGQRQYTISHKPTYKPNPSDHILKIAEKINEQVKDIDYCIWETQWINEFSQQQTFKNVTIIETERNFVDSLYYYLKDNLYMDIFLEPDDKVIQFYVSESDVPVVIQRLVTRSPTDKLKIKKNSIFVATLEKMLVDLIAGERLFHFYQGGKIIHIYENIFNTYVINFTRMFSYAKRRNKEEGIKKFMSKHFPSTLEKIRT